MIKVGILGIGNAGNQVVATAFASKKPVSLFALNSSDTDLHTIPDGIPKLMVSAGRGSGKNRNDSKMYLAEDINKVLMGDDMRKFLEELDLVFITSSTGGGTGSGQSLLLAKIMRSAYPTVFPIPIGIVPALKEAQSAHANTLEYLEELYGKSGDITYMLYDNEKFASKPTNVMMESVNNQIVEDIMVLTGFYNYATKYASIDDQDMLNLIKTPGRLVVMSVPEFREKDLDNNTVEQLLIKNLNEGAHVNIQKDRIVNRIGVIANINAYVSEQFDTSATGLQDIIGTPIENFEHLCINEDRKLPNSVFVILTGCTRINDRVRRINDRIEEIQSLRKDNEEEDDALNAFKGAELNAERTYAKGTEAAVAKDINVAGIFSDFGVDLSKF